MMEYILDIIKEYQGVMAVFSVFSFVVFVSGIVLVPWIVCRMPEDYFIEPVREKQRQGSILFRVVANIAKNAAGAGLILLGFVLLFIPGQGLITIFFGVMLMDFPGKEKAAQWLLGLEKVQGSLNWIRRKNRVSPFRFKGF
ncbi:MAG: hypothetical protein KJ658_11410 [Proteobacteria bacterium]|nr:hypothetical protein [Pseudomonadota bacterium]